MKVIKKQDTTNWSYKHNCSNCESELEVESRDVVYYFYSSCDPRESSYASYQASCAVCQKTFTIPSAKIPKLIQLEAKKRYESRPSSSSQFDR